MTTQFIHEDFLLDTPSSRELFHAYAEQLPVIDYHCHLSPREILQDRRWENLTQIWLAGDHYKWRAMRTCGVPERFITGDATDWEKFAQWAATVPRTLRNPLYHWTHLELRRPFGISDRLLSPATAEGIWRECNAMLATDPFSARGILRQMHVEAVCTTDDPTDSLQEHAALQSDGSMPTQVYPAFRPDRAMAVDRPAEFSHYVEKVGVAADRDIGSYRDYLEALRARHEHFHRHGCRLSDHGLDEIYAEPCTEAEAAALFDMVRRGLPLDDRGVLKLKSALLYEFAVMDGEKGWVQQFHLGALRNANSRMRRTLGPDTGFDSIGDLSYGLSLARFLDRLDADNKLARTILYNLNPRDNALIATMVGNFQDGSIPGKIQYGAAWWFLDQLDGMRKQLEALSAMGILSQFVGMLTDSRSFLSYPRHEYFRRLLCAMLGSDIERGLIPRDMALVGGIVKDICYDNARRYFPFMADGAAQEAVSQQKGAV